MAAPRIWLMMSRGRSVKVARASGWVAAVAISPCAGVAAVRVVLEDISFAILRVVRAVRLWGASW